MPINRNGSWVARFSYVNVAGVKKEYYRRGFKTKMEAASHEKELKRGIQEAKKAAPKTKCVRTFGQWAERWKDEVLVNTVRESGQGRAISGIDKHLIPMLGDLPIAEIKKSHGEHFKTRLRAKGLSPKTRNHMIQRAKQMLEDAADEELIARNPWRRLRLEETDNQAFNWLTPKELTQFLELVRTNAPQWHLEILLGCRAGLRASEVAGLFAEDIDLGKGTITIERSVVGGIIQAPKSKRSQRTIPAPSDLLEVLRTRLRDALLRPSVKAWDHKGKKHEGHPLSWNKVGAIHKHLPDTLKKPITKASEAMGRKSTHRDMRHTYASHLRLRGIPIEDIRDLLGHHSIQMTLRYAHISADRFADAAKELELVMSG